MKTEDMYLIGLYEANYKPTGDLVGFPLEIIAKMIHNTILHNPTWGADKALQDLEIDRDGAFPWSGAPEGDDFWVDVSGKDFSLFYEKYGRNMEAYDYHLNLYGKDGKWDENHALENKPSKKLKDFPLEVIAMMVTAQRNQGNRRSVKIFDDELVAGLYEFGFAWATSPEGVDFWSSVLNDKDFDLFFKKYPKNITSNSPRTQVLPNNISVQEFTDNNAEGLRKLQKKDQKVFDLTIDLIASLKVLEKRIEESKKIEPKAKPTPKPKAKPTPKPKAKPTPKPKAKAKAKKISKVLCPLPQKGTLERKKVIDDIDDLDFAKGGITSVDGLDNKRKQEINLDDLDF